MSEVGKIRFGKNKVWEKVKLVRYGYLWIFIIREINYIKDSKYLVIQCLFVWSKLLFVV